MGRIADAALEVLRRGPADVEQVAAVLRSEGVTRARNPVAAVRRALRDDLRVIELLDGRLASIDQALSGVELTTVVGVAAAADGRLEVEPDLAPLAVLGIGPTVPLPSGVRPGDLVAVRVDDALEGRITARRITAVARRPDDEAALLDAIGGLLEAPRPERTWLMPPIAHLATVALSVAAERPDALRTPGRPLTEVVAAAGYEAHMGWVGLAGTDWAELTEDEAEMLEAEVAELLMEERPADAAIVQERLLLVLRRHLPERVPAARRRLARALARAGRPEDALAALVVAESPDPEDWYEAAVIAYRAGDEVRARRWVQSGLARLDGAAHDEVGECLDDIAGDLDAQAMFLRRRAELEELTPDAAGARWLAHAVATLPRSYLVEALVEELAELFPPDALVDLVELLAEEGDAGRDVCLAMATVMPRPVARRARNAAGRAAVPRGRAVGGLVDAYPARAWATLSSDAPDQRQLVVTLAKEDGRVSPLVVLVDLEELGGALKDAFFLPDMVEERLERELFRPMDELGLGCHAIPLGEAIALISEGLQLTRLIGWEMPSLTHQPVVERIDRWLLRPGIPG